jgi:hypothetical protein
MPRGQRLLRLVFFLVIVGGAVAAIVFQELAYISSAKVSSYRQANNHENHDRNKKDWPYQVAVATDWLTDSLTERREWLNVLFTGLVALFTLTLSRATSQLSALARIQADDMQKLLRAAQDLRVAAEAQAKTATEQHATLREQASATVAIAEAAKSSAGAAERTVKTMEDTAERQLRAYVYVANASILEANSEYRPNIRIKFKNFGRTPAYEVRNTCRSMMVLTGKPDDTIVETTYHGRGDWQRIVVDRRGDGRGAGPRQLFDEHQGAPRLLDRAV